MAVRVWIRIRLGGREALVSALVNSGFEAEEPQLVIPLRLYEVLGMSSDRISIEDFSTAGGGRASGYRLEDPVDLELVLEDRPPVKAMARVTVLPGETEVIMSDHLASELGIVILDPYRGDWCLFDELGERRRITAKLQEWR